MKRTKTYIAAGIWMAAFISLAACASSPGVIPSPTLAATLLSQPTQPAGSPTPQRQTASPIVIPVSETPAQYDENDEFRLDDDESAALPEPTAAIFDFDAFHESIRTEEAEEAEVRQNPVDDGAALHQWAMEAYAESEYSGSESAAYQAAGMPNTTECENRASSWASAAPTSRDWLELYYEEEVTPTEVHVYQSLNPSQVVLVELLDVNGVYHNVYTASPEEVDECPYVLSIEIENADFKTSVVEVTVDQSAWGVWNQIDAVELVGYTGEMPAPPVEEATPTSAPDYSNYILGPEDAAEGEFYIRLEGDEYEGNIKDHLAQGFIAEEEYLLTFSSPEARVTLYLPLESSLQLFSGEALPTTELLSLGGVLAFDDDLYFTGNASMLLESQDGLSYSGSFNFTAYNVEDHDKEITVDGALNQCDLELIQ